MKILSYFLLLFLLMACTQVTVAYRSSRNLAAISKDCVKYLKKFKKLDQDAAVELELPMSDNLMNIITTNDGKVSGLTGDLALPDWFTIQYKELTKEYGGPHAIPWSKLTNRTKLDLIKYKTEFKKTTIFEERIIQGLKIKDKIELEFPEETIFLGNLYPKGIHSIDFSNILAGRILLQ